MLKANLQQKEGLQRRGSSNIQTAFGTLVQVGLVLGGSLVNSGQGV